MLYNGSMDEGNGGYRMMAPGAEPAARSYGFPGQAEGSPRADWPRVDDYRSDIDFESQEMIGGVVYDVMGSDYPHARRNGHLDYLLQGLAAPGYGITSDLKTRVDDEDDFASDSALVKNGIDPATGTRHLEEFAFEVIHKQDASVVTGKVPRMIRRGVRRVFAVFVKTGRVKEWSPSQNDWVTLHPSSVIEDEVLAEPLEVAAVLDAAKADDAVVRALAKKNNPEILRIRSEGEARGRIETLREMVLDLLESRGLDVPETVRDAVTSCDDLVVLKHRARRAAAVDRAEDVLLS